MSRQDLADAVNAYLWVNHGRRTSIDANYVGKLERGQHRWPQADYREAFRAVLGAGTDAEIGFYVVRSTQHAHRGATASTDVTGAAGDTVVPELDTAQASRLRFEPSSPLLPAVAPGSDAHLDEILVHLCELWHLLVRTDNLLGPRFALPTVLDQIAVVEALLETVDGRQREMVSRLGAQYAESASWLCEDAGDQSRALHWIGRAMEWAFECGDATMLSWAAYRRSHLAAAAGNATQAIGLVTAARRDEDRLPASMRAAFRVQEAYSRALAGDAGAAQRLLDGAHQWAANDRDGDARSGHGSFCTPGYIEMRRADCMVLSGQTGRAVDIYESSLTALAPVYQRDRASGYSRLARAHAQAGDPERAAVAARIALPAARSAGSSRIVAEIATVAARIEEHRNLPAVADLFDNLAGSTT